MTIAEDRVQNAQDRLGRLIQRAQSGEDREMARWVRETGERMVRGLLSMIRMAQYHDPDNRAFDKPAEELSRRLADVLDKLGIANLVFVEEQVYLNDIRIRYDPQLDVGHDTSAHFAKMGVGGITFNRELSAVELRTLISILVEFEGDRAALVRKLAESGFDHIGVSSVFRFLRAGEEAQARGSGMSSRQVHRTAKQAVDAMLLRASQNRIVDLLGLRKLSASMVDTQNPESISSTGVQQKGNDFVAHTLTVAQLSMFIGQVFGMEDAELADLATCALTHDLGYGVRRQGYAMTYERHAAAGLRTLIRRRGYHASQLRRMLAVLEHHEHFDRAGAGGPPPTLYSRIIHVADDYDTLTRIRDGGARLPPTMALARMKAAAGTHYDPIVLQTLINILGKYPPGTGVVLSDTSVGVSLSLARGPEGFDRPRVRLLKKEGGVVVPSSSVVDLLDRPDLHVHKIIHNRGAVFVEPPRAPLPDSDAPIGVGRKE